MDILPMEHGMRIVKMLYQVEFITGNKVLPTIMVWEVVCLLPIW